MLKVIYPTQANKLGVIAATYRAGNNSIFSSCPSTCSLLPKPLEGTTLVDIAYLKTELQAVPRNGIAWSYTHFHPTEVPTFAFPNQSTLNFSTDHVNDALNFAHQKYPTIYAAPHTDLEWPRRIQGIRFIRCPAELHKAITCQTCGGGHPLCARSIRDYVIVFVGHGSGKAKVGTSTQGGCYAAIGNCNIQWHSTMKGTGSTTWDETLDYERLTAWTNTLPKGTLLRHRISGDIGLISAAKRKIIPITLGINKC